MKKKTKMWPEREDFCEWLSRVGSNPWFNSLQIVECENRGLVMQTTALTLLWESFTRRSTTFMSWHISRTYAPDKRIHSSWKFRWGRARLAVNVLLCFVCGMKKKFCRRQPKKSEKKTCWGLWQTRTPLSWLEDTAVLARRHCWPG